MTAHTPLHWLRMAKSWPLTGMKSIRVFAFVWTLVAALALLGTDWFWPGLLEARLGLSTLQWSGLRVMLFAGSVWWVLGHAFKPVQTLGQDLIGRRCDDLQPVSTTQPSELLELTQAVNQLMHHQQASLDQQKKFLADASHQLRTPFAVLRTQLQGVMSGQLDTRETLPKMLHTVDRSSDLMRQLLAMAKVEQLVRQANWVEVDLSAVARDVVMEFAPLLARKKLDCSLQAIPLRLHTDPWMLGELIKNLMSNAMHHTPKGGALGLVIRAMPGASELIVWDNGGGMNEVVQARLFEPFQSSSGASGVGLGLSICRQIAESMNATVDLFNRVQDDHIVGVDAVVRWPTGLTPANGGDEGDVPHGERMGQPTPSAWTDLAHSVPLTHKGLAS